MAQLNPKHQLMMRAISWGILDLFEIDQKFFSQLGPLIYTKDYMRTFWSLLSRMLVAVVVDQMIKLKTRFLVEVVSLGTQSHNGTP